MPSRASKSATGTMSMASHGQPSRNAPSGPLLVQSLQPMHNSGSTRMRPNGAWSGSGLQYMHSVDRAILDAGRRAGAARAVLVDYRKDVRLAFALVGLTVGLRRVFDDFPGHILFNTWTVVCHAVFPRPGVGLLLSRLFY